MQFQCATCKDTGMVSWEKPMTGLDGKLFMVTIPQYCMLCDRGKEIWKNSQHLPQVIAK